ncbi:hypothetical protein BDR03DRAFT_950928 [Suillus americanus]|nr:hypothetical protein BDR03DRAFT_950928 [Suillus americanus]
MALASLFITMLTIAEYYRALPFSASPLPLDHRTLSHMAIGRPDVHPRNSLLFSWVIHEWGWRALCFHLDA